MIQFILLLSRQGKVRLAKWYVSIPAKQKMKLIREVSIAALNRSARMSNIIELSGRKYICKRYASLFFVTCVDETDNELLVLEIIHHFVEVLDMYFGNVCELDLIFNFHRAYFILDEVLLAGELQQSNKVEIVRTMHIHDSVTQESEAAQDGTLVAHRMVQALRNL